MLWRGFRVLSKFRTRVRCEDLLCNGIQSEGEQRGDSRVTDQYTSDGEILNMASVGCSNSWFNNGHSEPKQYAKTFPHGRLLPISAPGRASCSKVRWLRLPALES